MRSSFLYKLARSGERGWRLSNLAALQGQQLFVYDELFAWIDQPFQPPPLLASVAEQIPFSWSTNSDSRNANLNPWITTDSSKCRDFHHLRTWDSN